MPYRKPIQQRAIDSESKFLETLEMLLHQQSFEDTSIEQIASLSNQTKSAFIKRFGTKEEALFVLFKIYAEEASKTMQSVLATMDTTKPLIHTLQMVSNTFDELLQKHFAANRAMNEFVKRQLESHDLTKQIFGECIQMMVKIQHGWFGNEYSLEGSKAAAQILVSINFHYRMGAMPALPEEVQRRHELIAELIEVAIKH